MSATAYDVRVRLRELVASTRNPTMMRQLDYFTRGGSTGRREVFAEAFAALAGGGCLNHDILSAMPRTSQAVLDIVRSTGGRPADDGLTQGEMKRARLK